MPRIEIQRRPFAYAVAAFGVLSIHAFLCYPAAISRGHPPIDLFAFIAIYLAPIGMLLPPLFDDFRNDVHSRIRRTACAAAGFSFIWAIVSTNLNDARPHIGHLAGISGILKYAPVPVVGQTIIFFLPALLFFYCLEGVAIGFWSLLRGFNDIAVATPAPPHE